MHHPFVIDPVAGKVVSYEALGQRLMGSTLRYRPLCRPQGLSDVFENLATALAVNGGITLVDADFTPQELVSLGLAESAFAEECESRQPRGMKDLPALLGDIRRECASRITLFTSGSTGLPQRVAHPLPNLCRALRVSERHGPDVWGFAYNPTHIAGVQVFLQALFNQNTLVNLFGLPRNTIRDLIREHRISHLSATPSFYRLLLPPDDPLPQIQAVTLGGERTDADLLARLRGLFPKARFRNLYASTEAGTLLAAEDDLFSIPAGLQDRIRLRDGQVELHRSLLGHMERSAAMDLEWYATGDVVQIVAEEPLRFRIISRDRDWVNVGGNKVNPAEVETALLAHPAVREARVLGRRNSVLGQVLLAEIVPVDDAPTEVELRTFLAARLQAFKIPRLIRVVATLDKTRTGKVLRHG